VNLSTRAHRKPGILRDRLRGAVSELGGPVMAVAARAAVTEERALNAAMLDGATVGVADLLDDLQEPQEQLPEQVLESRLELGAQAERQRLPSITKASRGAVLKGPPSLSSTRPWQLRGHGPGRVSRDAGLAGGISGRVHLGNR